MNGTTWSYCKAFVGKKLEYEAALTISACKESPRGRIDILKVRCSTAELEAPWKLPPLNLAGNA